LKLIKKADIILIISVLALVSAWLLFFSGSEKNVAVITVNGKTEKTVDLASTDNEKIQIGNMLICADDSGIWVECSDCPDKLCEKTGKIKRAGEVIACVPKGVVITIMGAEVDGVTG